MALHEDRFLSFRLRRGGIRARQLPSAAPIVPVDPPTRTKNLSAVGSPDHGSYRRRKLCPGKEDTGGCACLSLWGDAGPGGYLIWSVLWDAVV